MKSRNYINKIVTLLKNLSANYKNNSNEKQMLFIKELMCEKKGAC